MEFLVRLGSFSGVCKSRHICPTAFVFYTYVFIYLFYTCKSMQQSEQLIREPSEGTNKNEKQYSED